MKICGAYERELTEGSYCEGQIGRRQSIRRCNECHAGDRAVEKSFLDEPRK